jgi:hypothetical protein
VRGGEEERGNRFVKCLESTVSVWFRGTGKLIYILKMG